MAFDGLTISNLIYEFNENILGGRIDKIYQPEKDEVILQIRNKGKSFKLLLTVNSSNPRFHFTNILKENPLNPPHFCMVLRKHLLNGKIIRIYQPNFERILNICVESINELGDYSKKTIIVEIMGKHSNIILLDEKNIILDSIKHISKEKSSVREVLPSLKYILPPNQNKLDPLFLNKKDFFGLFQDKKQKNIQEFIYKSYTGISPILAAEICNRSNISEFSTLDELNKNDLEVLFFEFSKVIQQIKEYKFFPQLISSNNKLIEFSSIDLNQFKNLDKKTFESISNLVETFYKNKDLSYRVSQKTQDLRKIILQNIERCLKKKNIQNKTLKSIENRNKLKLYGELITSNIYNIKKGMDKIVVNNFYSENFEEIEISLDYNLTPAENAQKYFKKYNKEKRTFIALQEQIKQNEIELNYLESVLSCINDSLNEQDINDIREELFEQGIIKKQKIKNNKLKNIKKSKPLHYLSSDNFNIYVGKNNKQNDELTLKFAKTVDIWLHTKDIPGSHVIIVSEGKEVPQTTLLEAGNLAVFYSKAKSSSLVPVDYVQKKYVKKPSGAKPGMVIYEKYQTMFITPNEDKIMSLKKVD